MSIDGWMDKEDVIHIHNGILLRHKKEWNLVTCDNMDRPWGHYVKWNKSNRGSQISYNFSYMWNLKNNNNKKAHIEREQSGDSQSRANGKGKVGEGVEKVETCRYKINK